MSGEPQSPENADATKTPEDVAPRTYGPTPQEGVPKPGPASEQPQPPLKRMQFRYFSPMKGSAELIKRFTAQRDATKTEQVRDELKGETKGSTDQVFGLSEEAVAQNQPPPAEDQSKSALGVSRETAALNQPPESTPSTPPKE